MGTFNGHPDHRLLRKVEADMQENRRQNKCLIFLVVFMILVLCYNIFARNSVVDLELKALRDEAYAQKVADIERYQADAKAGHEENKAHLKAQREINDDMFAMLKSVGSMERELHILNASVERMSGEMVTKKDLEEFKEQILTVVVHEVVDKVGDAVKIEVNKNMSAILESQEGFFKRMSKNMGWGN